HLLSWWLSGLTVLSDWLGSNREWFPFQAPPAGDVAAALAHYWKERARPSAARAVGEAGLVPAAVSAATGVGVLCPGLTPSPLQAYADSVELSEGPALYIIEDMTGAGKTEAAVTLAHRLMAGHGYGGIHIGLPTSATANAMYMRLGRLYRMLF